MTLKESAIQAIEQLPETASADAIFDVLRKEFRDQYPQDDDDDIDYESLYCDSAAAVNGAIDR